MKLVNEVLPANPRRLLLLPINSSQFGATNPAVHRLLSVSAVIDGTMREAIEGIGSGLVCAEGLI